MSTVNIYLCFFFLDQPLFINGCPKIQKNDNCNNKRLINKMEEKKILNIMFYRCRRNIFRTRIFNIGKNSWSKWWCIISHINSLPLPSLSREHAKPKALRPGVIGGRGAISPRGHRRALLLRICSWWYPCARLHWSSGGVRLCPPHPQSIPVDTPAFQYLL